MVKAREPSSRPVAARQCRSPLVAVEILGRGIDLLDARPAEVALERYTCEGGGTRR
jgi:hypothetical protein